MNAFVQKSPFCCPRITWNLPVQEGNFLFALTMAVVKTCHKLHDVDPI